MTEPHEGDIPDGLSAAELGMWQSFRNGTTYDLRTYDPTRRTATGGWRTRGSGRAAGLVLVGWVLATAVAAGATRTLRRG
ncbi:hypothetical protein SBADM41S_04213 [Streptomyces badius]